ncbi:hypothetical protein AWC11_07350 [Mycobacterium interjectum]|nr:hypothetical protein AWC11_07350 [Mycobacterium interjectum]
MTQPDPADYWTGPAVWLFNPLGYPAGAVMFIGPVLFPAGLDPANTQTAMMVLGPGGGQVQVPAVFDGQPGPSPKLRNINYTPVPYGEALPTPAAQFVQVIPGGPGVAAVYDLNIAVQQGEPGTAGSFQIADAEDFEGALVNLYTIAWNATAGKFNPQALPFCAFYNVTGIASTSTAAGQVRSLTEITIPPQPNPYVPVVIGASAEIAGTVNTQVDLVVREGGAVNTQTGVEVGRGFGRLGVTFDVPSIDSTFGGGLLTDGFGQIAAGTSATFYLNCEDQQATSDEYSTGRAGFAIGCLAVA